MTLSVCIFSRHVLKVKTLSHATFSSRGIRIVNNEQTTDPYVLIVRIRSPVNKVISFVRQTIDVMFTHGTLLYLC